MTSVPLPPAPGTAGHLSLALANSIVTLPGGLRIDELNSPEDATAWLVSHGLAPDGTCLLSYCQLQLAGLRGDLRETFRSRTEGTAPAPAALDGLNQALTAVPSAAPLHYSPEGGLVRGHIHPLSRVVAHAMAQIAEDAAELLTGPDAGRLASCAAAPCDRFMVRTHARRQWCSERCGARQRANRSYARRLDRARAE